ncbi:MAG TPA: HAMP domain-containing sensor histidine kinase [Pyrinomonadaceae bacterium]|nr:HAMP domain-containing sensor histidine kinase [Pyrinomonadaceae bacterium]
MVRADSNNSAPASEIALLKAQKYPFVVLGILLLLAVGATLAYYRNAAAFEDATGERWTPVVFLIGVCVSLVIFGMTHREAAARAVLHQKTLDLIEAQNQNRELLIAEQNARVAAERANRSKDEFLAVVSHELRTPLHAIAGWNRILMRDDIPRETQQTAVEKIEKNLRIQTAIIDELLNFSEVIAVSRINDGVPVCMRDVFDEAISAIGNAAFQKGITVEKENALEEELVSGDSSRLKVALVNVLSNAVKFTPPGGNINARAFPHDGCIKCVIADSGEGIPREFIPHIFEPYRQSEVVNTRHHGGLGLGLTIADQIIRLHNGVIQAESPGVGDGATFTISIPAHGLNGRAH